MVLEKRANVGTRYVITAYHSYGPRETCERGNVRATLRMGVCECVRRCRRRHDVDDISVGPRGKKK